MQIDFARSWRWNNPMVNCLPCGFVKKSCTPKLWSISSSTVCMSVNLGISLPVLDKPIVVPWFTLRQSNVAVENQTKFQLKFQFMGRDVQWFSMPCLITRGHLSNGLDRSVQFIFEAIRAPALITATWLTGFGLQTNFGDLSSSCESWRNVWTHENMETERFQRISLISPVQTRYRRQQRPQCFNDNYWVSDFDTFW